MWLLVLGAGTALAMFALRPGARGLGRFFSVCSTSTSASASQRAPLPPAKKVGDSVIKQYCRCPAIPHWLCLLLLLAALKTVADRNKTQVV